MKHKIIKILTFMLLCAGIFQTTAYAETRYDFATESGVTEQQLSNALYYELADYADLFVECENEYGVNAVLMASLAAMESGWARSDLAVDKNNLFGWKRSDGEYAAFDSKEQCILEVAESISENYISETGAYYTGDTLVENVAEYYSPSEEWIELLKEVADGITERCENHEKENETDRGTEDLQARVYGRSRTSRSRGIEFQICPS